MYPTYFSQENRRAPQEWPHIVNGRLSMMQQNSKVIHQQMRQKPSLPHKKKLLMRSHLAMKESRLQRPLSAAQRQASDATAILTAAQALLSLSPVQQQQHLPTHAPFKAVSNPISATQPRTAIKLPLLPEDEMDVCPSSSSSTAESTMMSDDDYHPPQQRHQASSGIPRTVVTTLSSSPTAQQYYTGCVSLALPGDDESLSPLHCFMRRHCVEAFSATAKEVSTPRYGKANGRRITVGQVGIRCLHCKHRPVKQERAVCFPSSLKNIYHSIETWQRRHSLVCQDITDWIKEEMAQLMQDSRSGAGGRRQYWEESAKLLGIVDTPTGLRFVQPPEQAQQVAASLSLSSASSSPLLADDSAIDDGEHYPVVTPQDAELVTGFLFVLLEQMETCQFTEQDRIGGRSKVKDCPTGFPGLQCRHCGGKAGFGRYFPTTMQALTSANSDRNIYNHIKKCRRCPAEIRDRLELLSQEQGEKNFKNKRGSRKMFFRRVWDRLHGGSSLVGSSTPSLSSCS